MASVSIRLECARPSPDESQLTVYVQRRRMTQMDANRRLGRMSDQAWLVGSAEAAAHCPRPRHLVGTVSYLAMIRSRHVLS